MIKGIAISKKNNIYLDLLRIFACMCVIGIHTEDGGLILNRIARLGLPMFFLLSGYFLLPKCDDEHVGAFYYQRYIKIVLPFLAYGLFYGCWIFPTGRIFAKPTLDNVLYAISYIPHSIIDNLTAPIYFHFWFMYEIISLYLLFPFLAKGMKALSDKGLRNLMILILVWEGLADFIPAFGRKFEFRIEFGWLIYIIFGYAFTREFVKKQYKLFVIAGAIAFALQIVILGGLPGFSALIEHKEDLNPWEVLAVCGWFALFMMWSDFAVKRGEQKQGGIAHVIHFLAAYTFSVYMIHGYIITWWSRNGVLINLHVSCVKLWWILTVLCVFVLSLAFAVVFDNLIVENITRFSVWINDRIYRVFQRSDE